MKTEHELIERVKRMQAECETLLAALKATRRTELKVDDKVMVSMDGLDWFPRHFSHFSGNGFIYCYLGGSTSWTTKRTQGWSRWRLPTEEEL